MIRKTFAQSNGQSVATDVIKPPIITSDTSMLIRVAHLGQYSTEETVHDPAELDYRGLFPMSPPGSEVWVQLLKVTSGDHGQPGIIVTNLSPQAAELRNALDESCKTE